jgi:hypothetical protein
MPRKTKAVRLTGAQLEALFKKETEGIQDLDEISWQIQDDEIPWDDYTDPNKEKTDTKAIPPKAISPNFFSPKAIPPKVISQRKNGDYFNIQLPVYAVWMSWVLCAAAWILGVAPWEWYGMPGLLQFWGIGGILTAIAYFARVTDWN